LVASDLATNLSFINQLSSSLSSDYNHEFKGAKGLQGLQGPQGPQGLQGTSCTMQPLLQTNQQVVPGVMVLKCQNSEIRLSIYQCGNGQIDIEESCDDGNVDSNDGCDYDCKKECGNAILNGLEQCDDGNTINTDSCTNTCKLASCGDGFIQSGEQCDDGNSVNTDRCVNCLAARCGDGFVQEFFESCDNTGCVITLGEECDDGNSINTDGCNNNCAITKPCYPNCPVMNMVFIQSGLFNMGSNALYEQAIHQVTVRDAFYIGKTEVTVGQYRACVNAKQCTMPNDTVSNARCNWTNIAGTKENHPLNCVDWFQAKKFAFWMGGVLTSEAQWEYVSRSQGQAITYPWGNAVPTCQLATFYPVFSNYCVNHPLGGTAPVCSTLTGNTNQGVCDMGGNVAEWVLDENHNTIVGAPINESPWCSDLTCTNTSPSRIYRGGSWNDRSDALRTTARSSNSPYTRSPYIGFRILVY
jgi:cysteine-rich repeat protein